MKAGTVEHIKFKRLKRMLDLRDWECIGLLESLWHFTARSHMDGSIGSSSNLDIAIAIDWVGDEEELVSSLIKSRWIDECEFNRLVVHDWDHHCPNYVKGNLAKHGRSFAKAGAKQVAKHGAKQVAKQVAKHGATKPSLAKPSLAKPSQGKDTFPPVTGDNSPAEKPKPKKNQCSASSQDFDIFYALYPRHQGKADALKAWNQLTKMNDLPLLPYLLEKIEARKTNGDWAGADKQFIPLAASWLRGERWDDDIGKPKLEPSADSPVRICTEAIEGTKEKGRVYFLDQKTPSGHMSSTVTKEQLGENVRSGRWINCGTYKEWKEQR